jgi:hypothetical protein
MIMLFYSILLSTFLPLICHAQSPNPKLGVGTTAFSASGNFIASRNDNMPHGGCAFGLVVYVCGTRRLVTHPYALAASCLKEAVFHGLYFHGVSPLFVGRRVDLGSGHCPIEGCSEDALPGALSEVEPSAHHFGDLYRHWKSKSSY